MESTVRGGLQRDGKCVFVMDGQVDALRRALWRTIHENRKGLPYPDIGMALGIVQYELLHHSDEKEKV